MLNVHYVPVDILKSFSSVGGTSAPLFNKRSKVNLRLILYFAGLSTLTPGNYYKRYGTDAQMRFSGSHTKHVKSPA